MQRQTETKKIWTEFHDRLFSFVRGRVKSVHDAEDILQDVFTKIHASAEQLGDVQSVSGWVFRITRNAITDYYRAQARSSTAMTQLGEDSELDGETATLLSGLELGEEQLETELARCLTPLVRELPEHYASAIEATELNGMTQRQAAEQAGVTLSGMKARVQRGRAKLKDELLQCCDFELDRRNHVIDIEVKKGCSCDGCD